MWLLTVVRLYGQLKIIIVGGNKMASRRTEEDERNQSKMDALGLKKMTSGTFVPKQTSVRRV